MSAINLKKNIAYTTGSQAFTMAASFVANWYLARFLGPELRGQYVYLITINSVIWLLLDLGVSTSLMYSLQREKADPNALYSMSLVFFGISMLLSVSIFQLFSRQILGANSYHPIVILALSLYIPLYQLQHRLRVISIGLNRIKDYSLLLWTHTVTFTALILPLFWLFPKSFRMEGSYLLYVSIMLGIVIFFHFRLTKAIKFKFRWDFPLVKRSYALGFKSFLSQYMVLMMTRVDVLTLKHLGSFSDLGIYMLAINFIDIITVTSNMIGVVLLNKFSALNDDAASLNILRRIFVLMAIFNTVCILGIVIFGRFVINFMYTSEYIGAYSTFIYLIPAVFGLTLGSLFNTFLWSKGFPIFTIIAPAMAALIKLLLSIIIIPKWGYQGAAITSSIAYPLWFIALMIWYFAKHKDQKISVLAFRREDFVNMRLMVNTLYSKLRG